tara:strand:+ start:699 stop:932 length:234 start_codon:yes stop_codon:yes gene_type:complete
MKSKTIPIINLEGEVCPMTFVKTRLQIEQINKDETIKFIYDSEEAKLNVPKSIKELGHEILEIKNIDLDKFYILIKK